MANVRRCAAPMIRHGSTALFLVVLMLVFGRVWSDCAPSHPRDANCPSKCGRCTTTEKTTECKAGCWASIGNACPGGDSAYSERREDSSWGCWWGYVYCRKTWDVGTSTCETCSNNHYGSSCTACGVSCGIGGTCESGMSVDRLKCKCASGWTGSGCSSGHFNSGCTCNSCAQGYIRSGISCIGPCPGTDCGAGGTCITGGALGYQCQCSTGWAKNIDGACSVCAPGYYLDSATTSCAICPTGHYCEGGSKNSPEPCPATTYGKSTGLATPGCSGKCDAGADGSQTARATSSCNGQCPAGRYCRAGQLPQDCGGVGFFCPAGSSHPSAVASNKYSTPEHSSPNLRTDQAACPDGWSCSDGERTACVAGLSCTNGVAVPCTSPTQYCPTGTGMALAVPTGYYSTPTGFRLDGVTPLNREGKTQCEPGYYCQAGVRAACGSERLFSTSGKVECTTATPGHYTTPTTVSTRFTRTGEAVCPVGHYCALGAMFQCPAGRYGAKGGLTNSSCSGGCPPGQICAAGTISATGNQECEAGFYCTSDLCEAPIPCGSIEVYCKKGSGEPTPANEGYYTVPEDPSREATRKDQAQCPAGHFCRLGRRQECGSAAYWSDPGAANCTAVRPAYYSTPEDAASVAVRTGEAACDPGTYCEHGVKYLAPAGTYAAVGVASVADTTPCPAGRYGASVGETSSACTGACAAGYYCPAGSQTPTAGECGWASMFCPAGVGAPVPVAAGHYSVPLADVTGRRREDQLPCAPGYYCKDGLRLKCGELRSNPPRWYCPDSEMSDPLAMDGGYYGTFAPGGDNATMSTANECEAGFYCSEGSKYDCGSVSQFCPPRSPSPQAAQVGWYTLPYPPSPTRQISEARCPAGAYCRGGERFDCPSGFFGAAEGMTVPTCSGSCLAGYWCPAGSTSNMARKCGEGLAARSPPIASTAVFCPSGSTAPQDVQEGYYTTGATPATASMELACEPGHFCNNGVKAECGGVGVVCRARASSPEIVPSGYYSVGGTRTTRQDHQICPVGSYCTGGVRRLCSAGYYGDVMGLSTEYCSGQCNKGFACINGSTSPNSTNAACQAGYYCPTQTSSTERVCGGPSMFCPVRSTVPTPVLPRHYSTPLDVDEARRWDQAPCEPGFFCDSGRRFACANASSHGGPAAYFCQGGARSTVQPGHFSTPEGIGSLGHRSGETQCDPGYWCAGGLRKPCSPGTYGSTAGLTAAACSGPCKAGYYGKEVGLTTDECDDQCNPGHYCPAGSTKARQQACGSTEAFCPEASAAPQPVPQGHYGIPQGCTSQCTASNKADVAVGEFALRGQRYRCPNGGGNSSYAATGGATGYVVQEMEPPSTVVGAAEWVMPDVNAGGAPLGVTFAFAASSTHEAADWSVDATTGVIATKQALSYNDGATRVLTVRITTQLALFDNDANAVTPAVPYEDTCTIVVQVANLNQAPVLDDVEFAVPEDAAEGTLVGTITAYDTDEATFSYTIINVVPAAGDGLFEIATPSSGKITVKDKSKLDFESLFASNFAVRLNVTVNDNHPVNPIASHGIVTVKVLDRNDLILQPILETTAAGDTDAGGGGTGGATAAAGGVAGLSIVLEEDGEPHLRGLGTAGGERICFAGRGFADLSTCMPGSSWVVTATYAASHQGGEGSAAAGAAPTTTYLAAGCAVVSPDRGVTSSPSGGRICCNTAPGTGSRHHWSFRLRIPEVGKVACVSAGVGDTDGAGPTTPATSPAAVMSGSTSYGPPTIARLDGALDMPTVGGGTVYIVGANLGPEGTVTEARYESRTSVGAAPFLAVLGNDVAAKAGATAVGSPCQVERRDGGPELALRCISAPGFGGPFRWRVKVGGQDSAWTTFDKPNGSGQWRSIYARPVVNSIKPAAGPTEGGQPLVITGSNFALDSQASIGPYSCDVQRSNHTHIEALSGGGVGPGHTVVVTVGGLSSNQAVTPSAVTYSYDLPLVESIQVLGAPLVSHMQPSSPSSPSSTRSDSAPNRRRQLGQVQTGRGYPQTTWRRRTTVPPQPTNTSEAIHSVGGPTRGGTILILKGRNFGPPCTYDRTCGGTRSGCAVRLGQPVACGSDAGGPGDATASSWFGGSWCAPLTWSHEEIMCQVEAGVGGDLPVGIVAGGVYTVERWPPDVGVPRFRFGFDAPAVISVTPSYVGVGGGETMVISGDNFGEAGTPVIVEPRQYLDCDHQNTSHTVIMCTTRAGRGRGHTVIVKVEGQSSAHLPPSSASPSSAASASSLSSLPPPVAVNFSYFPPRVTSVVPNPGQSNDPEPLTILGDNFGNFSAEVVVTLGDWPCSDAKWLPGHAETGFKSYITCKPRDGESSGPKHLSIYLVPTEEEKHRAWPAQYFPAAYTVACNVGEYMRPASGTCGPCPAGATCAGSHHPPIAKSGFMRMYEDGNATANLPSFGTPAALRDAGGVVEGGLDEINFVKCTPLGACSGGQNCSEGYESVDNFCVGCIRGFYKLAGECKECPKLAHLYLALYIAVILVVGVVSVVIVKKGPSVAVLGVGIDYYQVLSIFISFDVRWPAPVKDVLNVVSVSNLNIELVSPQCTIDFAYEHKWLAIELMPVSLVALAVLGYYAILVKKMIATATRRRAQRKGKLTWLKLKDRAHGKMHRHANAIIGAVILMFYFIYIYCTKVALEVFACETKGDASYSMYFEPEIRCWTGTDDNPHTWLVPLAMFFSLLYGVGVPVCFFAIVQRNARLVKGDQFMRVLGIGSRREENPDFYEFRKRFHKLYYRYKPRYYYWASLILVRKGLIVLITVFFYHNPTLQASTALMVLFVSYSLHIRSTPYLRNDCLDRVPLEQRSALARAVVARINARELERKHRKRDKGPTCGPSASMARDGDDLSGDDIEWAVQDTTMDADTSPSMYGVQGGFIARDLAVSRQIGQLGYDYADQMGGRISGLPGGVFPGLERFVGDAAMTQHPRVRAGGPAGPMLRCSAQSVESGGGSDDDEALSSVSALQPATECQSPTAGGLAALANKYSFTASMYSMTSRTSKSSRPRQSSASTLRHNSGDSLTSQAVSTATLGLPGTEFDLEALINKNPKAMSVTRTAKQMKKKVKEKIKMVVHRSPSKKGLGGGSVPLRMSSSKTPVDGGKGRIFQTASSPREARPTHQTSPALLVSVSASQDVSGGDTGPLADGERLASELQQFSSSASIDLHSQRRNRVAATGDRRKKLLRKTYSDPLAGSDDMADDVDVLDGRHRLSASSRDVLQIHMDSDGEGKGTRDGGDEHVRVDTQCSLAGASCCGSARSAASGSGGPDDRVDEGATVERGRRLTSLLRMEHTDSGGGMSPRERKEGDRGDVALDFHDGRSVSRAESSTEQQRETKDTLYESKSFLLDYNTMVGKTLAPTADQTSEEGAVTNGLSRSSIADAEDIEASQYVLVVFVISVVVFSSLYFMVVLCVEMRRSVQHYVGVMRRARERQRVSRKKRAEARKAGRAGVGGGGKTQESPAVELTESTGDWSWTGSQRRGTDSDSDLDSDDESGRPGGRRDFAAPLQSVGRLRTVAERSMEADDRTCSLEAAAKYAEGLSTGGSFKFLNPLRQSRRAAAATVTTATAGASAAIISSADGGDGDRAP